MKPRSGLMVRSALVLLFLMGALTGTARAQADTTGAPVVDRIIGVFNRESGSPLADVEVRDLSTGKNTLTPQSGAVSLARLGVRGVTLLQLRKLGYKSIILMTEVGRDTTPITVAMVPLAAQLPQVVVKGRRSADTVRKLELSGFYERRHEGFAPSYSYITSAELDHWHLTRLSDVHGHMPRDIRECAIFLDGVAIMGGVDGIAYPDEVAGIEIYNTIEAPLEYVGTMQSNLPCVGLIWTK